MALAVHDGIGLIGVGCIVGSYLALQMGRLAPTALRYSLLNALGAALVLVSLAFEFNAAAALVEAFWLAISLFGLLRAWRLRLAGPPPSNRSNRPPGGTAM